MKFSLHPYQLRFKFPFEIAHGLRNSTDAVYLRLEYNGFVAWGEATLPPYLPETQQSVIQFLTDVDIPGISVPLDPMRTFKEIDRKYPANMAAKAALDIALWSLKAQMEGKSISELMGIATTDFPLCTYTIGLCGKDELKTKIDEALGNDFQLIKIKLNGLKDEEFVQNFRNLCSLPFIADANQAWTNAAEASAKIEWLKSQGCLLIEQPLPVWNVSEMLKLKRLTALPLYADESCQRLSDIEKLKDCFDGINIKLMKCGGLSEAYEMILAAKKLDMKILLGCMSESSVGCTAAAALAPLVDYADLDGPYLIANDPFDGMKVTKGRVDLQPLNLKEGFLQ